MPGITNEEYQRRLTSLDPTSTIRLLIDELEAAQSTIRSLRGQLTDSEARCREAVFSREQAVQEAEQTLQSQLNELRELMQLTTSVLYDVAAQTMGGAEFVRRARNVYLRANAIK